MPKKDRFAMIEITQIEIRPVNVTVPCPLVLRGSSWYARLPPEVIRYSRLDNRDMLKINIIEAQRVKGKDE